MQLFIEISLLLITIHHIISQEWNYNDFGPDMWSEIYSLCDGRSQSPIDIKTACTSYRTFTPFSFSQAYDRKQNFTLINNRHSIVGNYYGNDSSKFTLTGGDLNGVFEFRNFHLHWGENSKSGSEHQVYVNHY